MLSQVTCEPKRRGKKSDYEFLLALEDLYSEWVFNGQATYRDAQVDLVDGVGTCYFEVLEGTSLDKRWENDAVRLRFRRLRELSRREPRVIILGDHPWPRYSTWQRSDALYLYMHRSELTSPVSSGLDGGPIPLYRLPILAETRHELVSWASTYRHYHWIETLCGPLEIPAYKQLADPHSDCMTRCRRLATEIEEATGKPTYSFLYRFFGRRYEDEEKRLCPGCGGAWWTGLDETTFEGLDSFAFRCDSCRLISQHGQDPDLRRSHIGEPRRQAKEQQT